MPIISLSKNNYIVILTLLCLNFCSAQITSDINKIKEDYQNCLDHADLMVGCSYDYYNKADSLLNVVYYKIRIKLNPTQKNTFKKEQMQWLKKRDSYFKKVRRTETNSNEGFLGNDLKMIIADKQAEFVFERIEELLKRL